MKITHVMIDICNKAFLFLLMGLLFYVSSVQFCYAKDIIISDDDGSYLGNVKVYLFETTGQYTGFSAVTDDAGEAFFDNASVPEGDYRIRVDLFNQHFWFENITFPGLAADHLQIEDNTVNVDIVSANGPIAGIKTYLFDSGDSYLGVTQITDQNGRITLELPVGIEFRVRADLNASQYWSDPFVVASSGTQAISINCGGGTFNLTVSQAAAVPLSGATCYVFNQSDTYLGIHGTTDADGLFAVALTDGTYKFRIDYAGYQFWTETYSVPEVPG